MSAVVKSGMTSRNRLPIIAHAVAYPVTLLISIWCRMVFVDVAGMPYFMRSNRYFDLRINPGKLATLTLGHVVSALLDCGNVFR